MSYNEYLRDKKRALPQVISPTRINTAGLFTQMQRYKAAVPQGTMESAGVSVQHKSGSNVLATIGNAAVCCAPAQATVTTSCGTTSSTTTPSGWPAIIVNGGTLAVIFNNNSVFVTGVCSDTVDFYNGGITDISATPAIQMIIEEGYSAAFIACYNKNGQVQWVAPILHTDENGIISPYKLSVDSDGLYLTGAFSTGTIEFFNGSTTSFTPSGSDETLTTATDQALFIAKYSLTGVISWVTKVENIYFTPYISLPVIFSGICVNNTHLYVCNYSSGPIIYNADGSLKMTLAETGDDIQAFIVQYNKATGVANWATRFDSNDTDSYSLGIGIACDANNVYTSGYFQDTIDYYPTTMDGILDISLGTLTCQNTGYGNSMFIIAYTAGGDFAWVNQCDDFTESYAELDNPLGYSPNLVVDSTGVYANVIFSNNLHVYEDISYNDWITLTTDPDSSIYNMGIIKYSTSGNILWTNKINNLTGSQSVVLFSSYPTYTDGTSLYATGVFDSSSLTFYDGGTTDPSAPVTSFTDFTVGMFVAKYDTAGRLEWTTVNDSLAGQGIGFDGTNVIVTGLDVINPIDNFYNANGRSQPTTIGLTIINNVIDSSVSYLIEYDSNGQVITPQITTTTASSSSGTCNLKLQPYPRNGYRPPRCDPPAINYPPVDPTICHCP